MEMQAIDTSGMRNSLKRLFALLGDFNWHERDEMMAHLVHGQQKPTALRQHIHDLRKILREQGYCIDCRLTETPAGKRKSSYCIKKFISES
jgi:hypothetical protein